MLEESHLSSHLVDQSEGMEKDIPYKWKLKAWVAILISDKTDF